MIRATFRLASEILNVVIKGNDIILLDSNNTMTTLDGLKFSYEGVIKEFPDLKDKDEWRKEALGRLKEHIKTFKTEKEKLYYIKDELTNFCGYEALYIQKAGFRPERFK